MQSHGCRATVLVLCLLMIVANVNVSYAASKEKSKKSEIVTDVKFTGNEHVKENMLRLSLSLKQGDILTRELLEENFRRLYNLGYFSTVGADVEDYNGGKRVIFRLVENPVVKSVKIKGNTLVDEEKILAAMQTKPGTVYSVPVLNSDVKNIQRVFDREGYILNHITDVSFEDGVLTLNVEENYLEEIKITGNDYTKDYVIRREMKIKPGEVFDNKKVIKSLQKVFNLGYFSEVKPSYKPGSSPGKVILVVEVKEQKTGQATVGGGYSSASGFVGLVEVRKKNWRGRGQTVNAKFEFGGVKTYELGFYEPYLNGSQLSFGTNIYDTKMLRKYYPANAAAVDYDEHRRGGDITIGKRFSDQVYSSLSLRDENVTLDRIDPVKAAMVASGIDPTNRFREGHYQTLALYADRDTRDNVYSPDRGSWHAINIETTGGILAGEDQFTKYKLTLRQYHSVTSRDVLAGRLMLGTTSVTKGTLPFYEEMFAGGENTIRGYELREFFGRKMMIANLELRHTLHKNFDAVLFYDYGHAWTDKFDPVGGAGIGFNFSTPIGPIRLDYGRGEGRGGKTYFSMGRMF